MSLNFCANAGRVTPGKLNLCRYGEDYPGQIELVRIRGIEPRSRPWQGRVLPLNHIRSLSTEISIPNLWSQVDFARRQSRSRPRLAVLPLQNIAAPSPSVRKSKNICFFYLVLPEGFEPPTTASKAAMISISPQERARIMPCNCGLAKYRRRFYG